MENETPSLENIWLELERGGRCIQRMEKANNFLEYEDAWIDFLFVIKRIQDKLNGLKSHDTDNKLKTSLGNYEKARKNDKWLNYITHARNAQGHSIQLIVEHQPGSLVIMAGPDGSSYIQSIGIQGEKIITKYDGSIPHILVQPHRLLLLPVIDRGITYHPPFRDCFVETGKKLHEHCIDTLELYSKITAEIAANFFSVGAVVVIFEVPDWPMSQKTALGDVCLREVKVSFFALEDESIEVGFSKNNAAFQSFNLGPMLEIREERRFKVAVTWEKETIKIAAFGRIIFSSNK